MRLPFLRPKPAAEPTRPAAPRTRRTGGEADADIETARIRARRRLVGALVLLVVGVIGFPLLFETQPRPLPLDIPIQLPVADGRARGPGPQPARRLPVTSLPADAGTEAAAAGTPAPAAPVPAVAAAASSAVAEAAPEPRRVATAPPVAAARPPLARASAPVAAAAQAASQAVAAVVPSRPAAEPRPPDGNRAAALLSGAGSPAVATEGRYVVQVGAYTDTATLRAARAKVEKLGLKTYTQVIEGDAGKRTRVRLGPYATRAEADAAAAKLKAAGLPGNVLAL
ncbi:MAG: SPOR domain-containing protein [Rubrivivax sp.]|nr:SPOR domain-containing protein [Rubrivivax sp.]